MSISSIPTGRAADDFWHRAMLLKDRAEWLPSPSDPLWLFSFLKGTEEEHQRLLESGFASWWIPPGFRIAFFRPLSSLTMWLDHQLWPGSPALMHLHSIAWYLVAVFLAHRVYQRFLAPISLRAANIATLFYAIDPSHGLPVGWIANRNALVATVFSFLALLVHDDAAKTPDLRKNVASAALYALALCGGENSVGMFFFLGAHSLFLDERTRRRERIRAFVPVLLTFLTWAVIYKAGNFGVVGSGVYQSPLHHPAAYFRNVIVRTPLLLAAELGGLSPDPWPFLPLPAKIVMVTTSLLAIVACAITIRRVLLQHEDVRVRRLTGFFLVGAVMATLPGTAAFPAARLLVVASVGYVGLLALICASMWSRPSPSSSSKLVRLYVKWTWLGHLILAPPLFLLSVHQLWLVGQVIRDLGEGLPLDGSATNKRLVVTNAPDPTFSYYMILGQIERGRSPPLRMLAMSGNTRHVLIKRSAERTFDVKNEDGFYHDGTDLFFRDPKSPFPVGSKIELSDATIVVTHLTPDGVPDEVRIELTSPLPSLDDAYVFRKWEGNAMVPFVLPAIGESVSFPGRRF